jgi:hypothetical protein
MGKKEKGLISNSEIVILAGGNKRLMILVRQVRNVAQNRMDAWPIYRKRKAIGLLESGVNALIENYSGEEGVRINFEDTCKGHEFWNSEAGKNVDLVLRKTLVGICDAKSAKKNNL